MFETLLVADRGPFALRVIRTARRMGVRTVAVYAEPDRRLPHVQEADDAVLLGADLDSYVDSAKLLEAAAHASAQAVHPGCSRRAEDPGFARAVVDAGFAWVGPSGDVMEAAYGAVGILASEGVPVLDRDQKMSSPRRIHVPILGLPDGTVVALGESDGSAHRTPGELAAEAPSPGVGAELRARLSEAAVRAGELVGCRNAATVECVVDPLAQEFLVQQVVPRLRAGFPVTELVTGIDLVEQQLRIAAGEPVAFDASRLRATGHAVGLRVCAEPQTESVAPVEITAWDEPAGDGVRVDAGYAEGSTWAAGADPLLALLAVHGADRDEALERARAAVRAFNVEGLETNLPLLAALLDEPAYASGHYDLTVVGRVHA